MKLNEVILIMKQENKFPAFSNYEEYLHLQYREDFEKYFSPYYHGDEKYAGGVVDVSPDNTLPNSYAEALMFCVANYFKILEARVIGFLFGYKKMVQFLKEFDIQEMHCSKGPVSFPLEDFGLIPPQECKAEFIELINRAAPIHWAEVKMWLAQKRQGGIHGVKQLFDDNVKYFAPRMPLQWNQNYKANSDSNVTRNLSSYNLFIDYDS